MELTATVRAGLNLLPGAFVRHFMEVALLSSSPIPDWKTGLRFAEELGRKSVSPP